VVTVAPLQWPASAEGKNPTSLGRESDAAFGHDGVMQDKAAKQEGQKEASIAPASIRHEASRPTGLFDQDVRVFTLYRNSATDPGARIPVATFDEDDGDTNRKRCEFAQVLFQARRDEHVKYWCEAEPAGEATP